MTYADSLEIYMLGLINEERTSRGFNPLELEINLNSSAEDHSLWMLASNVFSHTGSANSSATERMVSAGFDLAGSWGTAENIAIQTTRGAEGLLDDVEDLHISLMNSPGHRANILNPDLEYIGIGIETASFTYDSGYTGASIIVTQNFARTGGSVDLDDLNGGQSLAYAGTENSDDFTGTAKVDEMIGFGGNDTLRGLDGDDTLLGGAGNDLLVGGAGADILDGGTGIDLAQYGDATSGLLADLQNASFNSGDAEGDTYTSIENLSGSDFDDNLRGNDVSNVLWGESGHDSLYGRSGDDIVYGGGGNDTIDGGTGFDRIEGGNGNDNVNGDAGNDQIFGQAGHDRLRGANGNDRLEGGTGNDVLDGQRGNDKILGNDGDDRLQGGNGNDKLYGGDGQDVLNGGHKQDLLDGGRGNDTLNGDAGDDTLTGNAGDDVFVFGSSFGNDTITDFDALSGAEIIDLSGVAAIAGYTDLMTNHVIIDGEDVLIDTLNGNTIRLVGVDIEDLGADDFFI